MTTKADEQQLDGDLEGRVGPQGPEELPEIEEIKRHSVLNSGRTCQARPRGGRCVVGGPPDAGCPTIRSIEQEPAGLYSGIFTRTIDAET